MNIQQLLNDQSRFILQHLQAFIDSCNKPLTDKELLDLYQVTQMIRLHIEVEKKYLYAILQKNPSLHPLLEKMTRDHHHLLLFLERINISHIDEPFLYDKATELMDRFYEHVQDDQKSFFAHACDSLDKDQCRRMMEEVNRKMTESILRQMSSTA